MAKPVNHLMIIFVGTAADIQQQEDNGDPGGLLEIGLHKRLPVFLFLLGNFGVSITRNVHKKEPIIDQKVIHEPSLPWGTRRLGQTFAIE